MSSAIKRQRKHRMTLDDIERMERAGVPAQHILSVIKDYWKELETKAQQNVERAMRHHKKHKVEISDLIKRSRSIKGDAA